MPPLNSLDTWSVRSEWKIEKPKSKCFLIGEGANTEYWYFEALSCRLAKKGEPELIELKPVERTEKEKNQSDPRKLMEHALSIMRGETGGGEFIQGIDRVVVCFDTDIFKSCPDEYWGLLDEFEQHNIEVAVTYPSFELFLLLHKAGSLEASISPYEKEIIENKRAKGSRRRFIEKLASVELGMNLKSNRCVGELSEDFDIALVAEEKVNQDSRLAVGRLTSNVARMIRGVVNDGAAG